MPIQGHPTGPKQYKHVKAWVCDQQLHPMPKYVLHMIADRIGKNDGAWPSARRIAADSGLGRSTVTKAIAYLEREEYNFVDRRFRSDGRKSSNHYRLNLNAGVIEPECDWGQFRPGTSTDRENGDDGSRGGGHWSGSRGAQTPPDDHPGAVTRSSELPGNSHGNIQREASNELEAETEHKATATLQLDLAGAWLQDGPEGVIVCAGLRAALEVTGDVPRLSSILEHSGKAQLSIQDIEEVLRSDVDWTDDNLILEPTFFHDRVDVLMSLIDGRCV